ncbi:MAG: diaminopimelate epimerase [Phycisphaerales bacterium]|nr:diaminopimelate epimerase [Phycisphaerales bacterium]NNM24368.1 diaminopimelate epimerase [Phycisphaerales bacterium]
MHGLGNDYLFIDVRARAIDDPPELARRMSDRRRGVGADGIILIARPEDPDAADLAMRIFNADGSEAEMCGNGIRCLAKFAYERGLAAHTPIRVETPAGVLGLEVAVEANRVREVTVAMGRPRLEPAEVPVALAGPGPIADRGLDATLPIDPAADWAVACGLEPVWSAVGMGNPHLVLFCRALGAVPLEIVGPALERCPLFPRRTNVHFVVVANRQLLWMRTWERGSGVTHACGTGACAVAVVAALTGRAERATRVELPGGGLDIEWDDADGVRMRGPAVEVFEGVWEGA